MIGNGMLRQSFAIRVMYKEHNSWQGLITHIETGRELAFRSALEMLMIMDATIDAGENAPEVPKSRRVRESRDKYDHLAVASERG